MLPILISSIENDSDRDLMTGFYLSNKERLYQSALQYLSNPEDAQDIFCDMLERLIEHMDVFRNLQPAQQLKYAQTTIRNLAYSHFRGQGSTVPVTYDLPDPDSDPEVSAEKKELANQVRKIWNTLDRQDRALLEQRYILHWTDGQIAQPLGIKPQSVRMRLTRARRALSEEMEASGFRLSDWV